MQLRVLIVRYVEDYFPGIVECEFVDAAGHVHNFIEKGPVVSDEWPGPQHKYPMRGIIRCEILEQWHDPDGRDLVRITTEQPDYVETKDGSRSSWCYRRKSFLLRRPLPKWRGRPKIVRIAPNRTQIEPINYCAKRQATVNG